MFEDLKSISYGVFAFGSKKGMLDPSSVNAFTTAISGLNAEQAALALTTRGLTETQQKQVLLNAGLIASSDHISGSLIQQALANEGLDKEKQDDILINLGLMDSQTKELIATRAVTEELLRQQLINQGYQGEKLESMVASAMQTKQNGLEAMSWEVLGTKIKKASLAMLKNPLTWVVVGIAAIASLVKGYDALIGKHEKLAKQDLEKIGADLQEVEDEIASLETLQDKLIDAKGNKSELAKISEELNSVIGETKGLLNGESKAWDIANTKIEANIALLKEQKKQLQQDKVDKSRVVYDNNAFERDWNFDIDGETMRDYIAKYNENLSKWNSLSPALKESYGTAEHYAFLTMQNYKGGEAHGIDEAEWAKYWGEQVDYAYDVFADTIDSYEGVGGQGIVKQLISDMVWSGADLDKINDALFAFIDNSDIQDTINTYWESFTNPDINTEEALKNVRALFDSIIKEYPELKGFFNDYYNQIMVGGNSVSDNTVKNVDKMTVSLETLKTASESVATLQKAFKELSEDGYITVDTLTEIQKATGLTDTAWEEYESKLLNAKVGSNEFKQAMTDLTYKMIEGKVSLDGITSATEDEIRATETKIAAILRENNVLNANEIAHEAVERAKAKEIIKSKLSKGVTEENIKALMNEAGACDIAKDAYIYLIAQEILFNNNSLDTSKKIEALKQLAVQAGITGAMVNSILDTPYGKDSKTQIEWAHKHGFSVKQKQDENGEFLWTQDANGKWVEDWIWTDADGNTYENANEAALSVALKGFAGALNDENPLPPEYDPSDKNPSAPDKPDIKEADYSDYYDEILSDKQKAREQYKEEDDKLQRELEQAVEDKNLNDVDRIAGLIKDNNAKAVEQLNSQLSTSQKTLDDEILPLIYGIAPELQVEGGWDAVTDVQKEAIREKYKKAILDENNRWEEQSYDILSKNGNKQNEAYKQAEADHNKAIEKMEYELDMFDQLVDSADAYAEDIKEIPGIIDEWNDKTKDTIETQTTSIDDVFEEYKRHIDRQTDELQKQADAYDILINKAQALADGSKSMYDSLRSVRQLQRDISKELATNKALGEYLDEDTRKLLFNDDDYSKLSKKLSGISSDIAGISSWYANQINGLTEDNWYLEGAITAEYERRLAMKEKEYEIARAELDLEKKKQELNNILNEKNIRMLTKDAQGNYKWTQIHNVEEASRVAGEIAELEGQIAETRLQATEDSIVNQKQAEADALNAEKAAIEKRIEMINKETEELATAVEDITNPLMDFGNLVTQLNAKLRLVTGVSVGSGGRSSGKKSGGSGRNTEGGGGTPSANVDSFIEERENDLSTAVVKLNLHLDNNGDVMDDTAKKLKSNVEEAENKLFKAVELKNGSFDSPRPIFSPFDKGGSAFGKGFMFKDTDFEEMVLDPVQTDYFKNFVENTKGFDILAGYMSNLIKVNQVPFKDVSHGGVTQFNGDIVLPNVREPEDFMYELKKNLQHYNF